jgi:hypothetical protein
VILTNIEVHNFGVGMRLNAPLSPTHKMGKILRVLCSLTRSAFLGAVSGAQRFNREKKWKSELSGVMGNMI